MSDEGRSTYFQDLLKPKTDPGADPYALDQFEGPRKDSRLRVKYNRIKRTFTGDGGFSERFFMGAKMGFMVGGIFGGLAGVMGFMRTGQFLYVPVSILISGLSFGFFLGVGTIVRSDSIAAEDYFILIKDQAGQWSIVKAEPEWKTKFLVKL